jgi:hypothetical protein
MEKKTLNYEKKQQFLHLKRDGWASGMAQIAECLSGRRP